MTKLARKHWKLGENHTHTNYFCFIKCTIISPLIHMGKISPFTYHSYQLRGLVENFVIVTTCDRYSLQLSVNIVRIHVLKLPVKSIISVLCQKYLDNENEKFMDCFPWIIEISVLYSFYTLSWYVHVVYSLPSCMDFCSCFLTQYKYVTVKTEKQLVLL